MMGLIVKQWQEIQFARVNQNLDLSAIVSFSFFFGDIHQTYAKRVHLILCLGPLDFPML